jgi:hypothetical protein
MPDCAPIVLFIYNRPDHTRRTLAALAANPLAADSDLVIYADGPKQPAHREQVMAARAVAGNAVGFRSVRMVEQERNLGLAKSVIAGVTETCEAHGRAIVVEDDLIVAPDFLTFLNEGLRRYADEDRVFQISGYMFPVELQSARDSLFLPLISCWGWGTWQRAWRQFDPSASGYSKLQRDADLRHRFNLSGGYDYFGMLKDQVDGRIDSWGVRWLLSVFLKDGLVLYPAQSLVQNIGVDGSGSHGQGTASLQKALQVSNDGPRDGAMPSELSVDQDALQAIRTLLAPSRPNPLRQFLGRLLR